MKKYHCEKKSISTFTKKKLWLRKLKILDSEKIRKKKFKTKLWIKSSENYENHEKIGL